MILTIGIVPFIALAFICVLRVFCIFEMPFTKTIAIYKVLPAVADFIFQHTLFGSSLTFAKLLLSLWILGSLIFLVKFVITELEVRSFISKLPLLSDNSQIRFTQDLVKTISGSKSLEEMEIKVSDLIVSPLVYGYFRPIVILPNRSFSEKEFTCILHHEINHFLNRDMWVKVLIELLSILFWWNPFVHLFKSDLNHILEMHSDSKVLLGATQEDKLAYLEAIMTSAKYASQKNGNCHWKRNYVDLRLKAMERS